MPSVEQVVRSVRDHFSHGRLTFPSLGSVLLALAALPVRPGAHLPVRSPEVLGDEQLQRGPLRPLAGELAVPHARQVRHALAASGVGAGGAAHRALVAHDVGHIELSAGHCWARVLEGIEALLCVADDDGRAAVVVVEVGAVQVDAPKVPERNVGDALTPGERALGAGGARDQVLEPDAPEGVEPAVDHMPSAGVPGP